MRLNSGRIKPKKIKVKLIAIKITRLMNTL
jgi:hypothetical protein